MVTVHPDGTPRPGPIGLTDLPDGTVHPLKCTMFGWWDPPGMAHTWMGNYWRPDKVPTVKVTCGRCGARWFLLYADRAPVHANIAYKWAPAPTGWSPWTLVVRCSCRTETPVNLAKLMRSVEADYPRWQRLGELVVGDGRHASRNPERTWPRSRHASATAPRRTG